MIHEIATPGMAVIRVRTTTQNIFLQQGSSSVRMSHQEARRLSEILERARAER